MGEPSSDPAQRNAELLAAMGDAVIAARVDGTIYFVNPAAEQLYGYPAAELIGRGLEILIEGSLAQEGRAIREALLRGESWSGEFRVRRRDGTTFLAHVTDTPILNAARELVGVLGVSREITRQRQLESRAMTADRMASVGTLAAGAAHELNNPLSYVTANLRFLHDELDELAAMDGDELRRAFAARVPEMRRSLEDASGGAERMRLIVRDLKLLSRTEHLSTRAIELVQVAEAAIRLTAPELRVRARLVRRFSDSPRVIANEAVLGQVLVNLLHNAALSFDGACVAEPSIEVVIAADGDERGDGARIDVRDNGCGIPPQYLRRIFDPFFTTRPVGAGTGLGLSVAHALVTRMGGTIDVHSEVGRGSTFTLRFPPATGDVPEALSSPVRFER